MNGFYEILTTGNMRQIDNRQPTQINIQCISPSYRKKQLKFWCLFGQIKDRVRTGLPYVTRYFWWPFVTFILCNNTLLYLLAYALVRSTDLHLSFPYIPRWWLNLNHSRRKRNLKTRIWVKTSIFAKSVSLAVYENSTSLACKKPNDTSLVAHEH
jgi:hypothetical protein